ncbi:hypothetical protein [Streptomyces sp. NPDC058612]|uniref:hypothetical protein n=1 Tax=Streptomyces sp. NPDC058612 TaxID=3346555 RepID=UPI00364CE8BE
MIINLTGEPVRLYGLSAADVIEDDALDSGCIVIPAEDPPAYLDVISLGSPGDDVHGGRTVEIDLCEFHVRDLPAPQASTRLIVPPGVALASRGRGDLLIAFGDVVDTTGASVGHRLLVSPC